MPTTRADFLRDPLDDRNAVMDTLKGFKNAKRGTYKFKKNKVREEIDTFYEPHKGGEKR